MKSLVLLCIYSIFVVATAQDSAILPGWDTKEPGYELRVIAEGEGEDSGPYGRILTEFLDKRATNIGATCVQYEKLVWRKQHASFVDIDLFNGENRHGSALLDQFNIPTRTAFGFTQFQFYTSGPIIVGDWMFITGDILDGDTEDTLYFIYKACRAL
jgi:hypothetical protein